jgi:hypothetical protein
MHGWLRGKRQFSLFSRSLGIEDDDENENEDD